MPDLVWGPKSSGVAVMGVHIGASTSVYHDATSSAGLPGSLNVGFSAQPSGASATIAPVANGATGTVNWSPGITLTATINDCTSVPAAGSVPAHFTFKVSIRAAGSLPIRIGPATLPFPVNVQIDAFTVVLLENLGTHAAVTANPLGS